jgi:hypothetical protein
MSDSFVNVECSHKISGVDRSFWERFFHYLMDTPSQYLSPLFAALLLLPLSPLDVLAFILK